MSKKLHYFQLNGIAEPIRYILHYSGQKFEDIRYNLEEWPIQSVKDTLPYGKLPLYEEGDHKLNQSIAISRYIGSQNNLLPSDPWEQAVLDAAVFNIYDFFQQFINLLLEQDKEKKEANKKKIFDEVVPFWFSRFEKELKANNGFFGGKLSWADFVFVGIIECAELYIDAQFSKDFPTVVALEEKIRSLPGVKEYIAKRPTYVAPPFVR